MSRIERARREMEGAGAAAPKRAEFDAAAAPPASRQRLGDGLPALRAGEESAFIDGWCRQHHLDSTSHSALASLPISEAVDLIRRQTRIELLTNPSAHIMHCVKLVRKAMAARRNPDGPSNKEFAWAVRESSGKALQELAGDWCTRYKVDQNIIDELLQLSEDELKTVVLDGTLDNARNPSGAIASRIRRLRTDPSYQAQNRYHVPFGGDDGAAADDAPGVLALDRDEDDDDGGEWMDPLPADNDGGGEWADPLPPANDSALC